MGRGVGQALLAGTAVIVTGLAGLAVNAATSQERWPGPLDLLRRYAWLFVLLLTLSAAVLAWWQTWRERGGGDPRPPAAEPVPAWVVDREQAGQVVAAICDRTRRRRAVGITTSLHGAGGYGKTTLAHLVWAHRRVQRRFRRRVYKVTIGREVRGRAAVAQKVTEVSEFITGDSRQFQDPELAGQHLGRLLDERPSTLLILDDVWDEEQLAPFLMGGSPCVRLITTRNPNLLPGDTPAVRVDKMSHAQAHAVLTWQLPGLPDQLVRDLLEATGGWALLLRLTNRTIAEQAETGVEPAAAAAHALERLRTLGPAAGELTPDETDLNDPQRRSRAVRATVEAATALLPEGGAERFAELAVFVEDEPVPIALVARLWQATAGLEETVARNLCLALHRLSLVSVNAENEGQLTLHDVIRDYLRAQLGVRRLTELHGRLVDACGEPLPTAPPLVPGGVDPGRAWWCTGHGYLLDHLIEHLKDAGRDGQAEAIASDLRWVEARLLQRGPTAPWSDLARIGSPNAMASARDLSRAAHLLTPTRPAQALAGVLYNQLDHLPHWQRQVGARRDDPARSAAFLANVWSPPDLPDPALVRTLTCPPDRVRTVAISPDGTWLATLGYSEPVRIWNMATGMCTATLDPGSQAHSMAISPDGSWLVTVTLHKPVRIWDPEHGRCTASLTDSTGRFHTVVISPCGTWLATLGSGEPVHVWEKATGERTATLSGHGDAVTSVAFSPDGTWLATAGVDKTVRIWETATGACTAILSGHTDRVRRVVISPCGRWLASGERDGERNTVRTWNRAEQRCMAVLLYHGNEDSWVIWNDTWLATPGSDRSDHTVRIWNPVTGQLTATLTGHTGAVSSLEVSRDGALLATVGAKETVRIWNAATLECTATLTDRRASRVTAMRFSPDSASLVTLGYDHTRIWDPGAARRMDAAVSDRASFVRSVAFSPDGTWLATVGGGPLLRIWDRATGECTAALTDPAGYATAVAISPDGTWLAVAGTDHTTISGDSCVRRWNPVTGECTATITNYAHTADTVVISPDGTWIATQGSYCVPDLWDVSPGRHTTFPRGPHPPVRSTGAVAISPDGTWIATGGEDGAVRIWGRSSRQCIAVLSAGSQAVTSVGISADGAWLATGGEDGTVRIMEWTRQRIAVLTGHTKAVTSVAIAPDGTLVATTSEDGTTRIWDPETGETIALARLEKPVHSCAWAPDSRVLAVGGQSGLHLYALQLTRPPA